MKTNNEGRALINDFLTEYDPAESLTEAERAVNGLVGVKLTQHQFSALVCLVMGIGSDTFANSRMLWLINRKNKMDNGEWLSAVSDQFALYIYNTDENGKRHVDDFLIIQRGMECALFLRSELAKKRKTRGKNDRHKL